VHLLIKEIAEDLAVARSNRAEALKESRNSVARDADKEISKLEVLRERLSMERVSVQIVIVDDAREYKQIFVDIAENAKGITQAVKSRFDSTKAVNRSLEVVMEHELIAGRVDIEADRVQGDNPNLLGAKHVADIIRTLQVGIGGRISTQLESDLIEADLVAKTNSFFDLICRSFKEMDHVRTGILAPEELRKNSLLGSVTMLRVLAGVYQQLVDRPDTEAGRVEAEKNAMLFFRKLSNHMSIPITDSSPWLKSKAFQVGASAPMARMGDLRNLLTIVLAWAKSEPAWLRSG
jgi:hypothetical protein